MVIDFNQLSTGFIEYSKPKNFKLSNFIEKFPESKKRKKKQKLCILSEVQYWPQKNIFVA